MQAYDLIMLIVLGMATIFGAIKGFAWQVASLASILVSYIVAYRYRFDVAEMIEAKPPWNQFLAMLILYIGTSFVIWVGFRLISGMIDKVRLKEFDRHLGAAFGLAKGVIFCLLITMFAMTLLGPRQQAAICHSRSGYYIATALDRGVGILPKEIHDVVGPYLAQLDDKLKRGGAGELPGAESPMDDNGFPVWPAPDGASPGILPGGQNPGWDIALPGTGGGNSPLQLPPITNEQPASGFPWPGASGAGSQGDSWDWQRSAEALSRANDAMRQFGDTFESLNGGEGNVPSIFPPLNSAPGFDPAAPFGAGTNSGLRPSGSSGLRPSSESTQQAQQPGAPTFPRY